ncbi:PucR family transcriptional regulator [Sporolactobacillus kofuensis]|uniref:PucR family transcriptional regulator n=1 Tax=Sporolactobacillus kofuensis TaxID=269672 RepID=A0ABW1WF29_9BACL|nr:PucR family transcriptional regulator [Sporolactobacillus kofuensis]MCO7175030.1 PucR family transcriptional regulator ligand-binding domain-containing protein [Sporolactobacillus kofuensis]
MIVSDIFSQSTFSGFKLIAGDAGSDREIRNINMMDAPDIIDYLKSGDWLVTSGYHLKNNADFFEKLVRQMAEKGCAALGIKTKRFIEDIPDAVIQLANQLSFPLIFIPNSIPLVDIVNQTLSLILNTRTQELQFAIDKHQQFSSHIMNGEGALQILDSLSQFIGFPAALLDNYFKPIAVAHQGSIQNLFDPLKQVGSEFIQTRSFSSSFCLINTHQVYTLFPLYTYKTKRHFLVIAGCTAMEDRIRVLTIEQAVNVLAFELIKDEALKQSDRKIRDAFFMKLITDEFSSKEEMINRAKEFGMQSEQKTIVIVGKLDIDDRQISFTTFRKKTNDVCEFMEGELANLPFPGFFFVKDTFCICLINVGEGWTNGQRQLLPYLGRVQNRVAQFFSETLSFGLSNLCVNLTDIATAYQAAVDALHVGLRSGRRAFIQIYQSNGFADLLRMVPMEDLYKLYRETFQGLAFSEKEEDKELFRTLIVYFESNCQISETAKKLYIHRNTVIYRIEKCEQLLGKNLKDPETGFMIRFAFRLKSLMDEANKTHHWL